ncbi:YokU family protein [Bacillus sp. ISL-47]|uniref:YokU family protein n=1 Tax=Bacillus sp. ISL-47 TaxID=2819130 RepID=UPI001BEB0EB3|nr:YokU family protein [Bacillus sp. ISL-47]MBT2690239.1 YokU family protein [Bacillus sp. ISL-47]MBT2708996.1 YokU family protein [Pseudomonas sp. ISL-84]
MQNKCDWCESKNISDSRETVYWELPDGTRAIQISDTPSTVCRDCDMVYQSDDLVKEIDDQLFLIDTKKIGKEISYAKLMEQPRLLKRNYFDFTS